MLSIYAAVYLQDYNICDSRAHDGGSSEYWRRRYD